jgi:TonB family protein
MNVRRIALVSVILAVFGSAAVAYGQDAPAPRIRVSDDVMRGVLTNKVAPVYPPLARQARIQGTVILKVLINRSGDVYDVQLVSGHPMLAPAAVAAVKQWKYQPYLLNGAAVEVETTVQVIFHLEGEPAPPGANDAAPGTAPGEIADGVAGSNRSQQPQEGIIGGIVTAPPGDAGHPALPQRVRISSGVAQGLLLSKVNPAYPREAREQRVQGVVLLKVNIDKDGNVYNLELISGHPLLAPAAIEAVRQWKYKPYLLNGTPVEVETQVRISFTLTSR